MTEQRATQIELEGKALMIESAKFSGVYYGIHQYGKGISIIKGNNEIKVTSENIDEFLQELFEISAMYLVRKNKTGGLTS